MKPSHANERKRSAGFAPDGPVAGPDRFLANMLGWVVAGIGALILFGWVADIPVLRNPVPGQIEVKANTALGFLLSGLALAFGAWRRFRMLTRVLAAVVTGMSLVILLQYPAGQNWGVDEWLIVDTEEAVGTVHPGRMAAPTAVNFVLLGTALLLMGTSRVRTIATLALTACGVAVMAFTGTLYSVPVLDAFGPYTAMAAPTGVTFLLLGTGVFLAGGARLAGHARRHGLIIGFVGALLLLVLLSGAVLRNIRLLVDSNRRVVHTHEVIAKLDALFIVMQDLETGTRGFLLTGDEQFLAPAQPAPVRAEQYLRELQVLLADNVHQQERLAQLRQLVAAKLRISIGQAELRRRDAAEANAHVAAGEGKRVMDAIRGEVAAAIAEENRLLDERRIRTENDTAKTLLALGSGLVSSVVILVAVYLRLRHEIAVHSRLAAALRRSEESLAVTLHSIGDGVLATDTAGRVTLLNPVAELLTGWTQAEARGRPVAEVFNIIHEESRAPAPIPVDKVLATGEVQGLANHTALIARDGRERAIADSAAPIRDGEGRILGVVLVFRDVTESRRAQAQLDRFFELSLDFLCIASGDGYFKRVSPAVTDILGLSVDEFLATPYLEQVHPDDRAATQHEVERQMKAGEKVFHFENRYRHKDGTWRTLSWRSAPYGDLMYATARDVTESRRAQAQLDRFFELSLDFLCIASLDGWFKRASPAVTDILGWTVEEFLAMPYLEQIHPDDRESAMKQVELQTAGQKVMHYECRFRHKDGSWRMLAWRSVPYGGFMYATARDVTEARRAEQQIQALNAELRQQAVRLEHSRAELESIFKSLPGLYLVLTPGHDIIAASDAYLAATMTRREAIIGRGLFEVFPDNPDDPAADGARNLRASLGRVAQNRAPDTMAIQKYDVRRPDGTFEERYWSPINSPLLGKDGEVIYIIHRVEDVTDFVKRRNPAPGDTASLHIRLEQMEAEIFQSSRRVQQASHQLEQANKELESFSYSVSHDLRAPLRHVQGYVEMLSREVQDGLSEKGRRYLRTIADAAREMGTLIDDLLSFSRMGRAEMRETEVEPGPLVEEVRRSLVPDAAGREIRWTVAPLPRVRADAAMLRQVLVNLLGNAVKYTRKQPVAEIEIGCAGTEGDRLVFFVRDNGAGFDMKYADKLFGVFQRLHRADEFEGTGIGLANVRRIIGRHGGRTWAEARVGAGATFYFTLQAVAAPQALDSVLL